MRITFTIDTDTVEPGFPHLMAGLIAASRGSATPVPAAATPEPPPVKPPAVPEKAIKVLTDAFEKHAGRASLRATLADALPLAVQFCADSLGAPFAGKPDDWLSHAMRIWAACPAVGNNERAFTVLAALMARFGVKAPESSPAPSAS